MIKKKNIIIISLLMVLLVAGYIFAVNYNPAPENSAQTEPVKSNTISVFEAQADEVEKIAITNNTPFTLVKQNGTWYIEGKEHISIVQNSASSIAYNAGDIHAVSEIEKTDDLKSFGLDTPSAELEVFLKDSSHKFQLGSKTPTDNYYYMRDESTGKVYTISETVAQAFLKTPSSVRDLSLWNVDITKVVGAELITPDETLKIDYTALEEGSSNPYGTISVWTISSPFNHRAENKKVIENFLTPATSLTAEAIIEDSPSSLGQYNLTKTFTLKTTDKNYTLKQGFANGVNYVFLPEKNIVYSVSASGLAFTNTKAYDLIERLIAVPNITKLDNVSVNTPNVSATLSVKEKTTDVYTYYVDGKYAEESAFKGIYQAIMSLSFDGTLTAQPDFSKSLGTVVYTMANGGKINIEFFEYDELNVAVKYDGKTQFFMKKTKLSDMEAALIAFIKNPTAN